MTDTTGEKEVRPMGTAVLLAATIATGLMAGLFYAFACAVMPGLGRADDRTFVEAMRRINAAILNGWFAAAFAGALLLGVAAAALHLGRAGRPVLPWIAAGVLLYVVVLVVTAAVSVPLNDRLAAAAGSGPADARAHFEAVWVRWNTVRAVLTTAAFGCLGWALVLQGRPGP